jgi:hypothetical protein
VFRCRRFTLPEAQAPARLDEIRDTRRGFDFKDPSSKFPSPSTAFNQYWQGGASIADELGMNESVRDKIASRGIFD